MRIFRLVFNEINSVSGLVKVSERNTNIKESDVAQQMNLRKFLVSVAFTINKNLLANILPSRTGNASTFP